MNTLDYETPEQRADRIWRICQSCARNIYDTRPPNERYADLIARQLFGTAAQESGFEHERQNGPNFWGDIGAYSKWQLEEGSIADSLRALLSRPGLAIRAVFWLFRDEDAMGWPFELEPMLHLVKFAMTLDDNDKIGCLFARLHYLRDPRPIPETMSEQAAYWKVIFNSLAGKGTVAQYADNWQRLCHPIAGTV